MSARRKAGMTLKIALLLFLQIAMLPLLCFADTDYRVLKKDEISIKAMEKPLMSYSIQGLNALPKVKRMAYSILVKPNLSKEKYVTIIDKAITDITREDEEIDEISMLVYDNEYATIAPFNVARVEWCPASGWDSVTAKIAASNDRTGYKANIIWSVEIERKFNGWKWAYDQAIKTYLKDNVKREYRNMIEFDQETGTLTVAICLTEYLEPETWGKICDEHAVLKEADSWLNNYALVYKEIRAFNFTCIWKGKKAFSLVTDRNELDKVDYHKLYYDFATEADKISELNGYDYDGEKALELQFYRNVISCFKNKRLDL